MSSELDPSHLDDKERVAAPQEESEEEKLSREQNELEAIRINHHLRWEIKNLLDYIHWASGFPNDKEVVRKLEEALTLIPPISRHDEALQEYIRRRSLGQKAEAEKQQLMEEEDAGYLKYIEDCLANDQDILPLAWWRIEKSRHQ